jgi:hypothetical protein
VEACVGNRRDRSWSSIDEVSSCVSSAFTERSFDRKVGSGEKPKTTAMQDERLVNRMVLAFSKGEEPTAREISQGCGLDHVSLRTVQRRLARSPKLKNRMKVKKPFISPVNRIRRLEWCEEHKKWPLERWRRVIWSDESPFVFRFNRTITCASSIDCIIFN